MNQPHQPTSADDPLAVPPAHSFEPMSAEVVVYPVERVVGQQLPRPPRPRVVDLAFVLMLGAWLAGASAGLIGLFMPKDAASRQSDVRMAVALHVPLQSFEHAMLVIELIMQTISLGFWMWFIFAMRSGRDWARILMTVVGALGLLTSAVSLALVVALGRTPAEKVWLFAVGSGVEFALAAAATVLMFRPVANRYFRGR